MPFLVGLAIMSLVALVMVLLGLLVLKKRPWLLVWLRVNIGLALLLGAVGLSYGLYTLKDFHSLDSKLELGSAVVSDQASQVNLVFTHVLKGGQTQTFELQSGQWRLNAAYVKWGKLFDIFGVQNGVLLYSVEQQDKIALINTQSKAALQIWQFGRSVLNWLPGVAFTQLSTPWLSAQPQHLELRLTAAGIEAQNSGTRAAHDNAAIDNQTGQQIDKANSTDTAPAAVKIKPDKQ